MRYFIGCLALLLTYSACSTTQETVQPTEETEPVTTQPLVPAWYDDGVHFSSDSLALHGYSLASATDSSRAVELSTKNSLEYLRFAIDRTAEEIRESLVDSPDGSSYNSPSFIIQLRNTVSDLSLSSASFTRKHNISDSGVHYSYTRASISQSALYNLFEGRLEDDRFLQQLRSLPL